MMTTQEKAKLILEQFETATRSNGNEFLRLKDGSPQWMKDVIHDAHEGMLPNDHKYQFVSEALSLIADATDLEDIQIEADIYTSDLLAWLSSNLTRTEYMDQTMGEHKTFVSQLMAAQWLEKDEVLHSVLNSLENVEINSETHEELE